MNKKDKIEKLWNDGQCFFVPVQEKDAELPEGYHVYTCVRCNLFTAPTTASPDKILCKCENPALLEEPPKDLKAPNIIQKLGRYGVSYLRHIKNGRREATREQIRGRYSHCVSCGKFDKKNEQCLICGCAINLKLASEGRNKLGWADMVCEDKPSKWRAIEE